jgi:hypothetical protein
LDNKKTKVKTKSKKIKKSSILASIANIKQELQETHPQVIKQEPLLLYQEASTILNSTSRYNNINNNNNNKNVHASGKVKQMIELVEARLNASNSTVLTHDKTNCSVFANDNKQQSSRYQPNLSKVFPASSQKTCNRQLLFSQNKSTKPLNTPQVSNTLKSSTAVKSSKKTLRSSIDNRKQLTSTSRLDQKRQSIRKVNAFLNDLTTKINSNDKTSNLKSSKITTFKNHPLTSTQISSNVKTTIKEELSSEINIKSEPNDLIATTTTTITSISSIHSAVTRSVAKKRELIASNFNCQQNYRVAAATAALVNSTSKYTKTHERNTPLKSSKHELEEKRKAELLFKEKKENERLQERETHRDKLLQEKIEISKKKRDEKMKKITEQNAKRQEEAHRKREELDAKLREVEENKRKVYEEKKRILQQQQQQQNHHPQTPMGAKQTNNNYSNKINHNIENQVVAPPSSSSNSNVSSKNYDVLSTAFKSTKTPNPLKSIINTNSSSKAAYMAPYCHHNHNENYDINDLKSEDETDDDEEPNKPIPEWAQDQRLKRTASAQARKLINYTKMFTASSRAEIVLEDIFKIKRKNFYERSSSAIWNSPPVWRTNGLNGNESFRLMQNYK